MSLPPIPSSAGIDRRKTVGYLSSSMKPPDAKLEATAARWRKIAQRLAKAERSRKFLSEEIKRNRDLIAEQKAAIERLTPTRDSVWEWLYWPLRRKDVKAIIVKAPLDSAQRRRDSVKIRNAMNMRLSMRFSVRELQTKSGWYFRIIKRGPWATRGERHNEESTKETNGGPDDQ